MERGEVFVRVAVFALTVVVVVAGAAGYSYLGQPGQEPPDDEHAGYAIEDILPDRTGVEGSVAVERADDPGLVAIDRAHANRVSDSQLRALVSAVSRTGAEVTFIESRSEFEPTLDRADALVVVDPGLQYDADEVDAVESFVDDGGRLVMLGEPTQSVVRPGLFGAQLVTVENRLTSLSSRFGIEFGDAYLYNMQRNDGNFKHVFASAGGDATLTADVDRAVVYTAAPVESRGGTPLLVASSGTRRSGTAAPSSVPVAVEKGNVIAVGDTSFLAQDRYTAADNERVIGALVSFLVAGDRTRDLDNYPYVVSNNATVGYSSPALVNASQMLARDLRDADRRVSARAVEDASDAGNATVLVATYDYFRDHQVNGTGVTVEGETVSVAGFSGSTTNASVVLAPTDRFDLVVVGDSRAAVNRTTRLLADDEIDRFALSDTTAVVWRRANATASASPSPGGGTGAPGGPGAAPLPSRGLRAGTTPG